MIIVRNFVNVLYLFKIFELTDFSFFTKEVRDVCECFADKITQNTNEQNMQNFSEKICKEIIDIVSEKNVNVKYCILKAKENCEFSIYKHKCVHGKNYSTCTKLCILLSGKQFDQETTLDLASEVIGFDYSNVFVENKYVERQSNFDPLKKDYNICLSAESYFEIAKITNNKDNNRVYMIYSI